MMLNIEFGADVAQTLPPHLSRKDALPERRCAHVG
jgi:hypothetical protein